MSNHSSEGGILRNHRNCGAVNDETVGDLVVLSYARLPAQSDVIAAFKVVVKFRTKQFEGVKSSPQR